jgi:hypothetical protein
MINLLPAGIPPSHVPTEVDRLITLIQFALDPEAVGRRVAALMQAAHDSVEIISSADKVKADIAKEREALALERGEHEKQLAADRAVFEDQCNHRDGAINDRAAETEKLNAEAQAARAEALKITADLNARLERIKAAAA